MDWIYTVDGPSDESFYISSPGYGSGKSYIFSMDFEGIISNIELNDEYYDRGIRPVVRLKSETRLRTTEDENLEIIK